MKSLKKTLVLLVVFSMILSAVMPAFAATDVAGLDCEEEVARLEALKVVSGYEDGTYGPEKTITRAEMAVILCKMVGIDTVTVEENKNVPSKFSDVAAGEWYTGHINVAAGKGLLSGFPDGTFRPSEQLTMNQVLTLCVNALGRGEYVSQMGTWPANYIAEATKLGLLDGVKTSDANRGNVAVIVWNTIEAPAVWDVTGTEFSDGSINLSNSRTSLLSIYFRDYVNENSELKEIEEVAVAAGDLTVDNHVLVADTELDVFDYGQVNGIDTFDFNKNTVKNKKEKTYLNDNNSGVYVYVPTDVCEDLDELEGKNVTIILGEDNVAVAIMVEDKIETKDFLTAYDATKKEIVVGGTRYDLAKDVDTDSTPGVDAFGYTVVLNGKACNGTYATPTTPVEEALKVFGIDTEAEFKNIEKKIEAEITLNDEDEVATIELFSSYYINGFSDEALITKVKEGTTTYTIQTTEKNISWDIEAEEDEEVEFPKVYIDGEKATMRDLEAGMVITVVGGDLDANIVLDGTKTNLKIYATANSVVEGDATRVKNSNGAITLDGTVYTRAHANVEQSVTELEKYNGTNLDPDDVVKSEVVALYLNVHGEYAYVILDDVASDYTFGVVTFVSGNITWEGEDEEIVVRNIKLLLEDGTRKTFKLKADSEADKYDKAWVEAANYSTLAVGDFVAVEADADRVIEIEDGTEINIISHANGTVKDLNTDPVAKIGDYVIVTDFTAADKDDEEFKKSNDVYEYDSNDTTIFNAALTELEVVTKWKAILAGSTFKDPQTIAIFEDADEDVAKYMLVSINAYGNEDAKYAIVDNSAYLEDDGKQYVDFVGNENIELATDAVAPLTNINGWLVEYVMSSDKVASAYKLLDADKFLTAKDTDALTTYVPARTVDMDIVKTGSISALPSLDEAKFGAKVGNIAGEYVFTFDGANWDLTGAATAENITDANLTSEYGIGTVTGAVNTDTLVVTLVGSDTMVAFGKTIPAETVEQIELAEVKISNSGKITLVYVETDHNNNPADEDKAIDSIKLDKDLIKVYDLRNGTVEVKDIEDIKAEVDRGDSVFAIPARDGEYEGDGENLLFIVK